MQSEYRKTVESFQYDLPDGASFPITAPKGNVDGIADTDIIYESGVGESYAYFYWQCAWAKSVMEATTDDAQDTAFAQLMLWDTTALYRDHVEESSGTWIDKVVKPAQSGDPQQLKEYYSTGCVELIAMGRQG